MLDWLQFVLLIPVPAWIYVMVASIGVATSLYNLIAGCQDMLIARRRRVSTTLQSTVAYSVVHSTVLIVAQAFNIMLYVAFGVESALVLSVVTATWLAMLSTLGTVWRWFVARHA